MSVDLSFCSFKTKVVDRGRKKLSNCQGLRGRDNGKQLIQDFGGNGDDENDCDASCTTL